MPGTAIRFLDNILVHPLVNIMLYYMHTRAVPSAVSTPVIPVTPVVVIISATVPVGPAYCSTDIIVWYPIVIRIRIQEIRISYETPVIGKNVI
jgi:hypothetical protein